MVIKKQKMILTIITKKRKLVPQRLCCLELFLTFSTFSSSPCSMQLMHLCSAPWYMNVRLISFVLDMKKMYRRKIATRITPSNIVIAALDDVCFSTKLLRK